MEVKVERWYESGVVYHGLALLNNDEQRGGVVKVAREISCATVRRCYLSAVRLRGGEMGLSELPEHLPIRH